MGGEFDGEEFVGLCSGHEEYAQASSMIKSSKYQPNYRVTSHDSPSHPFSLSCEYKAPFVCVIGRRIVS